VDHGRQHPRGRGADEPQCPPLRLRNGYPRAPLRSGRSTRSARPW
jgi:hypothetical protein